MILMKFKEILLLILLFSSILLMIIILISNPKANALGLGSTIPTQRTLDRLTWNLIIIFFILTALISHITKISY
uniref:Probable protein-export membrane protein SecG n=1 Tax=Galdieria sulphuraria TaxID=130081 RepID=A0A075W7W2_GALSU|nr:preprotein translocase SecG subunit [Galdieria sulphuraria]AIG92534.1 preprotein translocase SecG subunit [Galdieria sulphuraria]